MPDRKSGMIQVLTAIGHSRLDRESRCALFIRQLQRVVKQTQDFEIPIQRTIVT